LDPDRIGKKLVGVPVDLLRHFAAQGIVGQLDVLLKPALEGSNAAFNAGHCSGRPFVVEAVLTAGLCARTCASQLIKDLAAPTQFGDNRLKLRITDHIDDLAAELEKKALA